MKMRTLTSLLALAAATLTPLCAHATGEAEASPTGKGIVGGAFLGAELVMVSEAAKRARARGLPLVGIGGITLMTAASVIEAGATSVAIIGDLLASGDPEARVRTYLRELNTADG